MAISGDMPEATFFIYKSYWSYEMSVKWLLLQTTCDATLQRCKQERPSRIRFHVPRSLFQEKREVVSTIEVMPS